MNRFLLAIKSFFIILLNSDFSEKIKGLLPVSQDVKEIDDKKVKYDYARILVLLQRDARFIDFLQEKIDGYSDAQIGAVARGLHGKCNEVLNKYMTIEPVLEETEGSPVTIRKGFDPSDIRLVGNVGGEPPFKGNLRHHGWKISGVEMPEIPRGQNPAIIEPAEIEIV